MAGGKSTTLVAVLVALTLSYSSPTLADCTSPAGPAGFVVYNEDVNALQYCNGTGWVAMGAISPAAGPGSCVNPTAPERTMIYNMDYSVMQFCNGQDWIAMGSYPAGVLIGPAGCKNIGDLCADGTVFAGYHPITHQHLFIPTTDQGGYVSWGPESTNGIDVDSSDDGRMNTDQVPNDISYAAFKNCKDLNDGGYNDWYLPSRVELYYLVSIRNVVEAAGNITNFQDSIYWTSSEDENDTAWLQNFSVGSLGSYGKSNGALVRCVRR